MLIAVGSITLMGVTLGGVLGLAARYLAVEGNPLEAELQAMLPGAQCGQCGYVGCAQAAAALARGEAPVTVCPPGGKEVTAKLAQRLGITVDLSAHQEQVPQYAQVMEEYCIGCTRCIRECSVNGIIGSNKMIHTVMTDNCHGCAKCASVCPTDAIKMHPILTTLTTWHWPKPNAPTTARLQ